MTAALSGQSSTTGSRCWIWWRPRRASPGVEVGQSYPFAPPVGLMFVLWDEEAERNWLAKEPTIPLRSTLPTGSIE